MGHSYSSAPGRRSPVGSGWERGLARIIATPWEQRPELAIVLAGQVVGRVVLEVDRTNITAALGYGVTRQCWGRGVATEAARAMMTYGFEGLSLAKVWARADPRNEASARVLEKIGMVREDFLRSHLLVHGERVDRVYYGILRAERQAARAPVV